MLTLPMVRKYFDKTICYAIFFLFILLLGGCGSTSHKREAGSIRITLTASTDVNLNSAGKAAPINITLYELKSYDNFSNSDYFSIYEGKNPALKQEATKIYDAILQPGESRTIDVKPGNEMKALGFVAAYREINKANWNRVLEKKYIYKKKSWWRKTFYKDAPRINVHFNTLAISIDKMD